LATEHTNRQSNLLSSLNDSHHLLQQIAENMHRTDTRCITSSYCSIFEV